MLRQFKRAVAIAILLGVAAGAHAIEVSIGPSVPVTADAVLQPERWVVPIDIATRDEQFGVLFSTRKDYWFSIIDGEHALVSTHLMNAAGFHDYGLPNTGAAFWTGNAYLAFWTVGDSIHLARIGPGGELQSTSVVVETSHVNGVPFAAAWNPRIGRGLIMWNDLGATFGPDGVLLETFAMDAIDEYVLSPPQLIPFGDAFAGVTRVRTPEYTGRAVVELFGIRGTRTELRRFAPLIDVLASPCGDELLVMEMGTVEGHTAHNVYRLDAAGEVLSFATLRQSPAPVPIPMEVLSCGPEGFEQMVRSSSGIAIERVIGSEVVARNEWDLGWAPMAARAGRYVLIADPQSYLRDDRRPEELVEVPLLLSAKDQMPIAGARYDQTDLLVLRTDDEGHYLMFAEENREIVRQLPEGDDHAIAISPDHRRALVAYVPLQGDGGGIRAVMVDLRTFDVSQPLAISTGSDIGPSVAPHPEGFLVAWERLVFQDLYVYRKEIVARVVPRSGGSSEERVLRPGDETGHEEPLLRAWGEGFLLLSSAGTVCWRIGCGLSTPFDLEATRLDRDLQPLWTRVVEADPELNEIPADATCAGPRCFAVWSRSNYESDPCITVTTASTVGTSMLHEQGFTSPPVILDHPGLNDRTPAVERVGNHWFVAWVTDGRPGCQTGQNADIRGAVFSREGSLLAIGGADSVLITSSPSDEQFPLILRGPETGRLYYSTVTPDHGTGAAERLQRRLVAIETQRQRAARNR